MQNGRAAGRMVAAWLRARRGMLLLWSLCVVAIFLVYGLYGLDWSIPRYTALLISAICAVFAGVDFVRFATRAHALEKLAGRFPTGALPETAALPEALLSDIVQALEAERVRLVNEMERRDKADKEYYAMWVHQIKIPISGLRLLLQGAKAEIPPARRTALGAELYRVEQYVGMVLQYQRLASLNADLQFEAQPVERLVKQAVKNLAPLFIAKNLPLEVDDLPGELVTDEKWLVFVLEQVLSNALKYTREGRVRIHSPERGLVCVQDTGTGIPPEDLPRIFERGFTGHTGREDSRATGLGLYLCREILTRLGFAIRVESTPGTGTTVTLDLRQRQYEHE